LPAERIFDGYDAVDNDYFAGRADEIRRQADVLRNEYGLPSRYFLSLGRFVAKKNLTTLLRAYRKFLDANSAARTHLAMVGAGEEEPNLRALCRELHLPICDHGPLSSGAGPAGNSPQVHFYGFRQIQENPVFYALADVFVLPSRHEEWGLVVNEAMASGLPVVVSQTAGCAEDLLEATSETLGANGPDALRRGLRRNGFVFDPASADELASIFLLLDARPAWRQVMGVASRDIVEKFSCRNFAEKALRVARVAVESRAGSTSPNRFYSAGARLEK